MKTILNLIAGTTLLALLLNLSACGDLAGPEGPAGGDTGPLSFAIGSNAPVQAQRLDTFTGALRKALEEQAGGTPENPIDLAVGGLNLARGAELIALYGALTRCVNLDLSACLGPVVIDTPLSACPLAKANIRSIKLADTVLQLEYTAVASGVFENFTGLGLIDIPGISSIGPYAFRGCASLQELRLPLAENLGNEAFRGCTGLESVKLPSLTSIGNNAFQDCNGLTTLEFPSLASIGSQAFRGCTGLASITLGPTPPVPRGSIFLDIPSTTTITLKVPAASVGAYESWKTANATPLWGPTITIAGY